MNLEIEKENFKNHVAKFTDYGNIKMLDFKNPDSSNYRIRFMFEEDYYRLHISGDLGELVATNYNNMTYEDKYYACKCGNVLMMKWKKYNTELNLKRDGLPYCLSCGQALNWND